MTPRRDLGSTPSSFVTAIGRDCTALAGAERQPLPSPTPLSTSYSPPADGRSSLAPPRATPRRWCIGWRASGVDTSDAGNGLLASRAAHMDSCVITVSSSQSHALPRVPRPRSPWACCRARDSRVPSLARGVRLVATGRSILGYALCVCTFGGILTMLYSAFLDPSCRPGEEGVERNYIARVGTGCITVPNRRRITNDAS